MQVDKIEATYAYLQEQAWVNNTTLFSEIPPDCNCLNQDLVRVTEKIKLRKQEKVDCEMVLTSNIFLTLFSFVKFEIIVINHSILSTQSTFQV